MPGDYQYDVFLSYCRKSPVLEWVQNHFEPRLKGLLGEALPYEPRVFVDTQEIEAGQQWPLLLQEALKHSRCLLAIWSPSYFRSRWCTAELESMMAREKLLNYRTPTLPDRRLVYPVVFADGEHFPAHAKEMQHRDLQEWNIPDLAFAKSRKIVGFHQKMKELTTELAALVQQAPPWQDDWPVELPQAVPPVTPHLPRLP
jgi:hypothetical protein